MNAAIQQSIRLTLALALALATIAGFTWYFATWPREEIKVTQPLASTNPDASFTPGQVRKNPKNERAPQRRKPPVGESPTPGGVGYAWIASEPDRRVTAGMGAS